MPVVFISLGIRFAIMEVITDPLPFNSVVDDNNSESNKKKIYCRTEQKYGEKKTFLCVPCVTLYIPKATLKVCLKINKKNSSTKKNL